MAAPGGKPHKKARENPKETPFRLAGDAARRGDEQPA